MLQQREYWSIIGFWAFWSSDELAWKTPQFLCQQTQDSQGDQAREWPEGVYAASTLAHADVNRV